MRNHLRRARPLGAALSLVTLSLFTAGCSIDRAPQGLRATPPGDGPHIVFDLRAPPAAGDSAAERRRDVPRSDEPHRPPHQREHGRADGIEESARAGFADMEGWGTFAPITLAFARGAGADPHLPAIDLDDVKARMTRDGHDFTNDPVYVINLKTGVPVMLDMGDGDFPLTLHDESAYWPNDPKATEQNLLFETVEEGAGLAQSDYSPALDLDFDGVLDHPNTLGPLPGGIAGVDDLLTWYERETDTLILRPLIPMDEMTEYAVVVTDRLRASDGRVARSPFPYVNHPEQQSEVAKVVPILADPSHANYYGDIAGSGLGHVAFAWTFTDGADLRGPPRPPRRPLRARAVRVPRAAVPGEDRGVPRARPGDRSIAGAAGHDDAADVRAARARAVRGHHGVVAGPAREHRRGRVREGVQPVRGRIRPR